MQGRRLYTEVEVRRLRRIALLRGLGLSREQTAEAELLRGRLSAPVDRLRRGAAAERRIEGVTMSERFGVHAAGACGRWTASVTSRTVFHCSS